MRHRHPLLKKILSLLLSFTAVMPVVLTLIGESGSARADTSLPSIQAFKLSGGTFNILELVPEEAQGSIGYYIDGQEPCANWARDAAKQLGKVARSAYVNNLFTDLSSAGLLGSGNTNAAPLEKTVLSDGSLYKEVFPWEAHVGYAKMDLENAEQTTVNGSFTPATNGAFIQNNNEFVYTLGGDYVQVIDYFITAAVNPKGSDSYYYAPIFAPVGEVSALPAGTAIYKNTASYDDPEGDVDSGDYVYEGTLGAVNFPGLEIGKSYYYVTSFGAPSAIPDLINSYVAASSAYRLKTAEETGYFDPKDQVITYRYVGNGGTYSFEASVNGGTANIIYNTVYYQGGFTNNNWFLRYVFDWSPEKGEAKPGIIFKVRSLVASTVTSADVGAASMIVLSKGFVPNRPAAVTPYSGTNDIALDLPALILAAVEKASASDTDCYLPVIVDNRLIGGGATRLAALATSLKTGNTTDSFVDHSVFFFSPEGTVRTNLATVNFRTAYPSTSYATAGSAFYPAYEEIVNENFLRRTESPTAATLEEKVSMATAIRYIINFAGKRIITPKTTVNVLEVQPGSGTQLTAGTVKQWLGYPANSTAITVTIDTMSTAELIGKIDIISELYDIVYIGSKVSGFNPTNLNTTNFNDDALYGLIYAGIGDTVKMQSCGSNGFAMSGLLDRDYVAAQFSNYTYNKLNVSSTAQTKTFRYSGNDITQLKMQELLDYINSGFPMIVADNLTTGGRVEATEAVQIRARVSYRESDKTLVAEAVEVSGKDIPARYLPSYKWYATGSTTVRGTASTYTPTASGTYYCTISYTLGTGTYTATSNTVELRPKTEYAANPSGSATSGSYTASTNTYTLTLAPLGRPDYRVSVTPSAPSISYQWQGSYYDTTNNNYWNDVGTNSPDFRDNTPYYYFRCIVTINGTPVTTGILYYADTQNVVSSASVKDTISFNVNITRDPGDSGVTLTADTDPVNIGATLQWYKKRTNNNNYDPYSTAASITVASGVYYCTATKSASTARSLTYTISSSQTGYSYTVNTGGTPTEIIASQPATNFSPNPATVDSSSYMSSLLDSGSLKLNVMKLSALSKAENQDRLNKYVNLSKPQIVYAKASDIGAVNMPYPTVYSNNDGTITSLASNSLDYYFSVSNSADPDPSGTRYTCNLYIDANGDGQYNATERLSDTVVRTWNSTTKTAGNTVTSTALKADTIYYVSRTIPSGKYGILPWKLEIIKTGTSGIISHTSDQNYTHLRTPADVEKTSLDILQINSQNGFSLADQMQTVSSGGFFSSVTNLRYKGIYGKLFADISYDYKVTITTLTISAIEPSAGKTWTHGTQTFTNLLDYLKSYDMLITGFEDSYGSLSLTAASAIVSYISTGKAILFTHDNTSFFNIPFNDYQTSNSDITVDSGWGYYFNTTIRDAVGLDRYGVTDPKYGISSFAPQLNSIKALDWNGLVAKSYTGASASNLTDLINAGYSVAYQPKTARSQTAGETQGFTRGVLDRYKGSTENHLTTYSVSQVNQGQITTYPYNVNTSGFISKNPATNAMAVAETHFQYYQLNMNSADTVVWYCLNYYNKDRYGNYTGNNDNANLFNDAINSYYIYSKGNVTYSGAGHTKATTDINNNVMEAKLFVNTMIAAYRIAQVPPVVTFSDASGKLPLENFLMMADSDGVFSFASTRDPARYIYFTVTDPSIGANKMTTVSFSYGESTEQYTLPVYKAETNTALATQESLISGLSYYIKVDDLWAALPTAVKSTIGSGIDIHIKASTRIGVNPPLTATTSLTLRSLMLFALG